jgi:hypothetical protein
MTSTALHTSFPRRRAHVRQGVGGRGSARRATVLRAGATVAAVFGAVGGIMSAVVLLFATAVAMLGLFTGVFAAVPAVDFFSGK